MHVILPKILYTCPVKQRLNQIQLLVKNHFSVRLHERNIRQAVVSMQHKLKEKGTVLVKELKEFSQKKQQLISDAQMKFREGLQSFDLVSVQNPVCVRVCVIS